MRGAPLRQHDDFVFGYLLRHLQGLGVLATDHQVIGVVVNLEGPADWPHPAGLPGFVAVDAFEFVGVNPYCHDLGSLHGAGSGLVAAAYTVTLLIILYLIGKKNTRAQKEKMLQNE